MYQNLCVFNYYYKIKMNFISTSKSTTDLPIILNTFHEVTHPVPYSQAQCFSQFKNQWRKFTLLISWHNGRVIKNMKMQKFSPVKINYSGVYKHRKLK